MPTFDSLIAASPPGFAQGCCAINDLSTQNPDFLRKVAQASIQQRTNYVAADAEEAQYANEIRAINHIARCAKSAQPQPKFSAMAAVLDGHSFLSGESVELLLLAMKEAISSSSSSDEAAADKINILKVFRVKHQQCHIIYYHHHYHFIVFLLLI